MNEGVAIFLVHFNGTLDEQGDNHAYIGGKTRLFTLPYTSEFDELIYTIHDRIGTMPNETRVGVKCQAPIGKFLKPIIIDIEDDKDFKAVLEMFKNSTISLGMLYVTKFKPIEDTQPTSTSMPSPSLCGDRTIYAVENVDTLNAPSYNFTRSSPENPLCSPENPLRDYQTVDAHFDGGAPQGHQHDGLHELSNAPRVQNEGSLPQPGASDHTEQGEAPMHRVEVPNQDSISSNVKAGEDVLNDGIIRRGQSYPSLQQFKTTLREYAIRNNFEYRTKYSNPTKLAATCASEGCSWRIHASLDMGKFTIKTYNSKHTCSIPARDADHKQATYLWIAEKMIDAFRVQPSMNAKSIQAFMLENWRIQVSYKKAHLAKEKMLEMVNGYSNRRQWQPLVVNPPRAIRKVGRPRTKRIQEIPPRPRSKRIQEIPPRPRSKRIQ